MRIGMCERRQKCDLCGSKKNEVLVSRYFTEPVVFQFLKEYYKNNIHEVDLTDTKYEVAKCRECGFIWQVYILDSDSMAKLYNNWVLSEHVEKKANADWSLFVKYAREVESIFVLTRRKPSELRILDFGMGWGYWCQMVKAYGCNIMGFDISRERIDYARRLGINAVDQFSDLSQYRFHFVNAEQIFEHIRDPLQVLNRLVGCLESGGVIRISVPDGRGVEKSLADKDWKPSKDALHPLEHINCFTHKTLVRLARESGLSLVRNPSVLAHRYNTKFHLANNVRNMFKGYYLQYSGTTLYFMKK